MLQYNGAAHEAVTYSDEVTDEAFEALDTEEECAAVRATPNHPWLCCEVRAKHPLVAGTELTSDYVSHPEYIFGTHYGFSLIEFESEPKAGVKTAMQAAAAARTAAIDPSQRAAPAPEALAAAAAAKGSCATLLRLGEFRPQVCRIGHGVMRFQGSSRQFWQC